MHAPLGPFPLMGWSGRAPVPPAISWLGAPRRGARHGCDSTECDCRIGIDIGKNCFHIVGLDGRVAIVLRQKWPRGQVEAPFANMSPCLIGMEAFSLRLLHELPKSPVGFAAGQDILSSGILAPREWKNDLGGLLGIAALLTTTVLTQTQTPVQRGETS